MQWLVPLKMSGPKQCQINAAYSLTEPPDPENLIQFSVQLNCIYIAPNHNRSNLKELYSVKFILSFLWWVVTSYILFC